MHKQSGSGHCEMSVVYSGPCQKSMAKRLRKWSESETSPFCWDLTLVKCFTSYDLLIGLSGFQIIANGFVCYVNCVILIDVFVIIFIIRQGKVQIQKRIYLSKKLQYCFRSVTKKSFFTAIYLTILCYTFHKKFNWTIAASAKTSHVCSKVTQSWLWESQVKD